MPILPFNNIMPRIHPSAFIAANAVIIGDVEIGADSSIWHNCVVRGDVNIIRIGERTNIQDGSIIHVAEEGEGTFIGNDVTVGHMALLHDCTINDFGFVGMRSAALDGSVIESWAMLAAGALLTAYKRIPEGELWSGMPAKLHRKLNNKDHDGFRVRVEQYVALAKKSPR